MPGGPSPNGPAETVRAIRSLRGDWGRHGPALSYPAWSQWGTATSRSPAATGAVILRPCGLPPPSRHFSFRVCVTQSAGLAQSPPLRCGVRRVTESAGWLFRRNYYSDSRGAPAWSKTAPCARTGRKIGPQRSCGGVHTRKGGSAPVERQGSATVSA